MDNNKLTGKIPSEIGNMKNLRLLGLSANELTGAVPPELLHLTHLQELRLGYNQVRINRMCQHHCVIAIIRLIFTLLLPREIVL